MSTLIGASAATRPGDPSGWNRNDAWDRLYTDLKTQAGKEIIHVHHAYAGSSMPTSLNSTQNSIDDQYPIFSYVNTNCSHSLLAAGDSGLLATMTTFKNSFPRLDKNGRVIHYIWVNNHEPENPSNWGTGGPTSAQKQMVREAEAYFIKWVLANKGTLDLVPGIQFMAFTWRTSTRDPLDWLPTNLQSGVTSPQNGSTLTSGEKATAAAAIDCYPKTRNTGTSSAPVWAADSFATMSKGITETAANGGLIALGWTNCGFGECTLNNDAGAPSSFCANYYRTEMADFCVANNVQFFMWFDNASGMASGTGVDLAHGPWLSDSVKRSGFIDFHDKVTASVDVPRSLTSGTVSATSVQLSWTAPADTTGVVGYNIYKNGTLAAQVTSTTGTVTGLTAGTQYSFTVRARDASGNTSLPSNTVTVTTGGGTQGANLIYGDGAIVDPAGASIDIVIPTSPAISVGDLIIVQISTRYSSTQTVSAPTGESGWSQFTGPINSSNAGGSGGANLGLKTFYFAKILTSGDLDTSGHRTKTFTPSTSTQLMVGTFAIIRGVDSATWMEQVNIVDAGTTSDSTVVIPTLTTGHDNVLDVLMWAVRTTNNTVPAISTLPSNYTLGASKLTSDASAQNSGNGFAWSKIPTAGTVLESKSVAFSSPVYRIAGRIIVNPSVPARTGKVKVWNGTAWVSKPIKVWNGSAWVIKPVKVWNGSAWVTAK